MAVETDDVVCMVELDIIGAVHILFHAVEGGGGDLRKIKNR